MVPLAVAGLEYGALASRGGLSRLGSDLLDGIASADAEVLAWGGAAVAIVLLATRRGGRLGFGLLLACAVVLTARWLDLP